MKEKRVEQQYPDEWEYYYQKYKDRIYTKKYVIAQLGLTERQFEYLKRKYRESRKTSEASD